MGAKKETNRNWVKSPWKFTQYGQSGMSVSELFPHIATCVDDITFIRSMVSGFPLHPRANLLMHTGRNIGGYPSLGSWVNYALGSENKNLPGYVLLHAGAVPPGGLENFSNGFLPATYQATAMQAEAVPSSIRPSPILTASTDICSERETSRFSTSAMLPAPRSGNT